MRRPTEPLFLARDTYRRRRMMDAARLMPFLGVFLFLVPAVWGGAMRTLSGLVYLFVAWALLILIAAMISHLLSRRTEPNETQGGEAGD